MAQAAQEVEPRATAPDPVQKTTEDVDEQGEVQSMKDAAKQAKSMSRPMYLLALAAILLGVVAAVLDVAVQAIITNRSASLAAAYSAVKATMSWSLGMFWFLPLGSMTLIGKAAGAGDTATAGVYARLAVVFAFFTGIVGLAIFVPLHQDVLALFGQEEVVERGKDMFLILACVYPVFAISQAMNGVMMGLMFVFVLVGAGIATAALGIAIGAPLFLATDLELKAFSISFIIPTLLFNIVCAVYLLAPERRQRYGFLKGRSGITLEAVRTFFGNFGVLSIRSVIIETRYMISVLFAINLGITEGAVYMLIFKQTMLVDKIATMIASALNWMGARIWAQKYHVAFWRLFDHFLKKIMLPIGLVFTIVCILNGKDGLAAKYANDEERPEFEEVTTDGIFAIAICLTFLRAFYSTFEQALIVSGKLKFLLGSMVVSFLASLVVSIIGFTTGSLTVVYVAELVFIALRLLMGAIGARQLKREFATQNGPNTHYFPEIALWQSFQSDPDVCRQFGMPIPEPVAVVEQKAALAIVL